MTSLIETVNKKIFNIAVRKQIARAVILCTDFPVNQFITSSVMFKGYLINLQIKNNEFQVHLIDRNIMWILWKKKCSYSLVNFISCTREWLITALTKPKSNANPKNRAKRLNLKPFTDILTCYHCLTLQQQSVIDNYSFSFSYL